MEMLTLSLISRILEASESLDLKQGSIYQLED